MVIWYLEGGIPSAGNSVRIDICHLRDLSGDYTARAKQHRLGGRLRRRVFLTYCQTAANVVPLDCAPFLIWFRGGSEVIVLGHPN